MSGIKPLTSAERLQRLEKFRTRARELGTSGKTLNAKHLLSLVYSPAVDAATRAAALHSLRAEPVPDIAVADYAEYQLAVIDAALPAAPPQWQEVARVTTFAETEKIDDLRQYGVYAGTQTGQVRRQNEDGFAVSVWQDPVNGEYSIFAEVADGMGGQGNGDLACKIVLSEAQKNIVPDDPNCLGKGVQAAYDALQRQPSEKKGAGACLVTAVLHGDKLRIRNFGDTRSVCIRDGKIAQLSLDDSFAARENYSNHYPVMRNGFNEQMAKHVWDFIDVHPFENVVLSGVNVGKAMPQQHELTFDAKPGDVYLFFSDGVGQLCEDAPDLKVDQFTQDAASLFNALRADGIILPAADNNTTQVQALNAILAEGSFIGAFCDSPGFQRLNDGVKHFVTHLKEMYESQPFNQQLADPRQSKSAAKKRFQAARWIMEQAYPMCPRATTNFDVFKQVIDGAVAQAGDGSIDIKELVDTLLNLADTHSSDNSTLAALQIPLDSPAPNVDRIVKKIEALKRARVPLPAQAVQPNLSPLGEQIQALEPDQQAQLLGHLRQVVNMRAGQIAEKPVAEQLIILANNPLASAVREEVIERLEAFKLVEVNALRLQNIPGLSNLAADLMIPCLCQLLRKDGALGGRAEIVKWVKEYKAQDLLQRITQQALGVFVENLANFDSIRDTAERVIKEEKLTPKRGFFR